MQYILSNQRPEIRVHDFRLETSTRYQFTVDSDQQNANRDGTDTARIMTAAYAFFNQFFLDLVI